MAITVTYSDGRKVVSDRGKTTEFNARGKKIVRLVKTTTPTGGTRFSRPSQVRIAGLSKNDTQNILPFITAAQREAANKNATARLVIESLAASRKRQEVKRLNTLHMLTLTPDGRRNLQVLSSGQASAFLSKNKNAPFSKDFRAKIQRFIEQNRPAGRRQKKFRFEITVLGDTYGTDSKKEAKFLLALKKTISRDQKFKKDFRDAIRSAGLNIGRGDKILLRAFKGAGQTGIGLLFSGRFIANAVDKLVIGVGGILTPNSRREVLREAGRAAKKTPITVAKGLDPTKPENWANIIIVATAVIAKGFTLKKVNKAYAKANKTLKLVTKAKIKARRLLGAKHRIVKKLIRQERKLKAIVSKLDKKRSLPSRALKVKTKTGKVGAKSKIKIITKKSVIRKETDLKDIKFKGKFRRSSTEAYQRKKSGFTRKAHQKALKEIKKSVQKPQKKPAVIDVDVIKGKPVIKISAGSGKKPLTVHKPVFRTGNIEVNAGTGQKLLLKTTQRIIGRTKTRLKTKVVSKTKVKTYTVSQKTLTSFKSYYKRLLALARVGSPFSALSKKLSSIQNKLFLPLLTRGVVSSKLLVKQKSAVSIRSLSKSRTGLKVVQKQATAVKQANAILRVLASISVTTTTVLRVERLIERLHKIRTRLRKLKKPFRFPRPKKKKRLSRRQRDEWDKIYSKVKKKYRPSLAALLFGIYGYRPKKVTGFEIRPLIKRRKKLVRKRKKRS